MERLYGGTGLELGLKDEAGLVYHGLNILGKGNSVQESFKTGQLSYIQGKAMSLVLTS